MPASATEMIVVGAKRRARRATTPAARIIAAVCAASMPAIQVGETRSSPTMSGTKRTFTAPSPSIETAAAIIDPLSAREPRTMAKPSSSERRTSPAGRPRAARPRIAPSADGMRATRAMTRGTWRRR